MRGLSSGETCSIRFVNTEFYLRLGVTLALGLLIGMQREISKHQGAGIRTFALISLSGFLIGLLATGSSAWIIVAGVAFLGFALYVETTREPVSDRPHGSGSTTEIAALIVFGLGVFLSDKNSEMSIGVIFGGITALLLYYKRSMHDFVRGLEQADVHAIMQFVLITLVILPILPNEVYGTFSVFNPFKAWLMVVLIVGIGLTGYLLYKVAGNRVGTILGGLLGGLISSTATTASAARIAKCQPHHSFAAALIVMIASCISAVRVIIEMLAVNYDDFLVTGPPIILFLASLIIATFILYRRHSVALLRLEPPGNPAQLKPALFFGVLYVLVLFAVAAAREHLGESGLYAVAIISGLTDMDAITLSTAALIESESLAPHIGWRLIQVAAVANLAFKSLLVAMMGSGQSFRTVALFSLPCLSTGILLAIFWP